MPATAVFPGHARSAIDKSPLKGLGYRTLLGTFPIVWL